MNQFRSYQISGLLYDFIAENPFATTFLDWEFRNICSLSNSIFRYHQQGLTLGIHLHAYDLITIIQIHANDTHGYTAGYAHIRFMETNGFTKFGNHKDIPLVVCSFNLDQLIIFPKNNGLKSGLSDIGVLAHRGLLYHTIPGCHKQELLIIIFLHGNDGGDLLARKKLDQVHDSGSSGCSSCFWDRICL